MELYTSLRQTPPEIRLFTLCPGSNEEPIRRNLSVHSLDNIAPYEALSYTWGGQAFLDPIIINNTTIKITPNLHSALSHLRYPSNPRVLWIDSICINQSDIQERNPQVMLMHRIYPDASLVFIWLGPTSSGSAQAMSYLQSAGRGEHPSKDLGHIVHEHLFTREWWGRMWIVQEAVLAKDSIIVCGHFSIPWTEFMHGAYQVMMGRYNESSLASNKLSYAWRGLQTVRDLFKSTKVASLGEMLQFTKDCDAGNPRDKIYGCLGMLGESDRQRLQPDYSKEPSVVFQEAAMLILETSDDGYFSNLLFSPRSDKKDASQPSWVPELDLKITSKIPDDPRMNGEAIFDWKLEVPRSGHFSFRDNNQTLVISGFLIDKITNVMQFSGTQKDIFKQIAKAEALAHSALTNPIPPISPRSHWQVLKTYTSSRGTISPFPLPGISPPHIMDILTNGSGRPPFLGDNYSWLYDIYIGREQVSPEWLESYGSDPVEAKEYMLDSLINTVKRYLPGRNFFTTSELGLAGSAGPGLREGDCVVVLAGEEMPIILRPVVLGDERNERKTHYEVVGSAMSRGL